MARKRNYKHYNGAIYVALTRDSFSLPLLLPSASQTYLRTRCGRVRCSSRTALFVFLNDTGTGMFFFWLGTFDEYSGVVGHQVQVVDAHISPHQAR
jgi:hypothetical protein